MTTSIESCGCASEPHTCASDLEHDLDRALVDVQDRDAEIARLRAENEALRIEHKQSLRWSETLHEDVEARLRTQIANYEANHGAHCDAEQERYATIAESACRMLAEVRERLVSADGVDDEAIYLIRADIATFLSLPNHEVPGLRAQVAARDRALDACAARIASAERRVGILADAADLIEDQRDEARGERDLWRDESAELLRDLATTLHAEPAEDVVELAKRRVAERDEARFEVTARDCALDACAARIHDLLDDRDRLLGIAQRNGEDRDHWRAIARDESEGLHAELRTVRRYLTTAEQFVEAFRGLTEVHLASIERIGSALCDREALLQHVRAEMLRLSEVGGATRMDLEMLALKVDVSRGGAEPGQDGGDSCAR